MEEIITIILRSSLAFVILLIMTRIMGKTQISQLTFFDYIVGITIGSTASSLAIETGLKVSAAVTGIVVWGILAILFDKLALKSRTARHIFQGKPTVVIREGKLLEKEMAGIRYDLDELMTQLRNEKIFDISVVQEAVLETDGKLSVLLKAEEQPPTRKDLNIDTGNMGKEPHIIIVDGKISSRRLINLGLDEAWLIEQLRFQGINDISEVMVAQLGTRGELYVDKKMDW